MSEAYKKAGVDVKRGYEAVQRMKKHIEKTNRPEVLGDIGAFAGLFELTKLDYKEPVLVSGTDGVGTKLMIAFQQDRHDTVGIDLVAMCVNDIVAQGADPLFFLDYIGCGKNSPEVIEKIVSGVAEGCKQSGAALIGGETAEMPGMYEENEYDLAGFAVGIAEKSELITGKDIKPGDAVIGLPSNGVHSNGYSLIRAILKDYDLTKDYDRFNHSLGEELLIPTKIYAKEIKALRKKIKIKGISHITGGGFYENFPRVLPKELGVSLEKEKWQMPEIFKFLQEKGNLTDEDMYGTFNMGIGMAVIIDQKDVDLALGVLKEIDEKALMIGTVIEQKGVFF